MLQIFHLICNSLVGNYYIKTKTCNKFLSAYNKYAEYCNIKFKYYTTLFN